MAKKEKAIKQPKKKPIRSVSKGQMPQVSTQKHLPFSEIKDGVVVMKDGTLRRVILVSSLNFALKSEDEQKGIIQGYVQFLNTVDYELQIVIQSRTLNIEKYLAKLDSLSAAQDNELLRKQTKAYRSFIDKLVEDAQIMDKKFFVVIPYSPFSKKKKGFFERASEVLSPASIVKLNDQKFEQYKTELDRRVRGALSGLKGVGLKTQVLDTQALIELYYNTYNPVTKQNRRIESIEEMRVDRTID